MRRLFKHKVLLMSMILLLILSVFMIVFLGIILQETATVTEGLLVMNSRYSQETEQFRQMVMDELGSYENKEDDDASNDHYTQYTEVILAIIHTEMNGIYRPSNVQDVMNRSLYDPSFIGSGPGLRDGITASSSIHWGVERFIGYLKQKDLVIDPEAFRTVQSGNAGIPAAPAGGDIDSYVTAASKKWGVPESIIHAIIWHESRYKVDAKNPSSSASGLMQILTGTGQSLTSKMHAADPSWPSVWRPFDAYQNIMTGTYYLSYLYSMFHSWELVVSAYYAGEGAVMKNGNRVVGFTRSYVDEVMDKYRASEEGAPGADVVIPSTGSRTALAMSEEQREVLMIVIQGMNFGEDYVKEAGAYNIEAASAYMTEHDLKMRDEKYAEKIMLYLEREKETSRGVIEGSIDLDDMGEFGRPVSIGDVTRISSHFGPRRAPRTATGRGSTNHQGIDISCPTGTPIHAARGGTVIWAGWRGGYGNLVAIDHGGGITTRYAHNSRLLVSTGDAVSQGDVIALAGSTGNSGGPHCHFEIRINCSGYQGQAIDAEPYLDYAGVAGYRY